MRYTETRNRALALSLVISVLFHLSMVTVFNIVIFFPREDIDYYNFDIIDPQSYQSVRAGTRHVLRTPSADSALADFNEQEFPQETGDYWNELPPIELPTIEFAELRRLRATGKSLAMSARYDELLGDEPKDSWARFHDELTGLSDVLTRWTARRPSDGTDALMPVTRPAPGFEAYIEWMSGPTDRHLISAPAIDALWGVEEQDIGGGLTFVFRVNAEGKVVEVLSPVGGNDEVITSAGIALSQYRFEQRDDGKDGDQEGTFILRSSRDDLGRPDAP